MTNPLPPFMATDPDIYEQFMGRWSERLAKPFLEFAGIRPDDRVLDIGCGTGTLSLALAQHGAKVAGMDASEPYLDGARFRRFHPDITYEHGDACHLRYPTATFDACVSTLAIDVIPDVDQVAAEMRRVTRPGGIVASGTSDFWGGNSVILLRMTAQIAMVCRSDRRRSIFPDRCRPRHRRMVRRLVTTN